MQRRLDEIVVTTVTEHDEVLQAEERRLEAERARIQRNHEVATNNAHIAARLRLQHRDDQVAGVDAELEKVGEERDQMAFIREGTPLPAPIVVEPIAVPPIVPQTPIPPAPAPTSVVPVTPPPPVAVRERSQFHPRNWTFLAWIFAFIGLIFAWNIVGNNWDEAIFESWFSTAIWVGGLGLGFFIGGTIGQALALRLTPTPTPVVVAQPRQTPTPPPA